MGEAQSSHALAYLHSAVHRGSAGSREGVLERIFTSVFSGLVYPQIWEDPEVDLRALELEPGAGIVAIASGGCNILSYLTADPREIVAVDLNHAHVALTKLKLSAVRFLPSYGAFYRFFGEADAPANVAAYDRFLRNRLDPQARLYWEGRDFRGRKRINLFERNLYAHGLLGYFIRISHLVARFYGVDPRRILTASTLDEQRRFFETALAPLFEKRLVRWATSNKASLFGLGIPPAQYERLATAGTGGMAAVLKARLERLACGFTLADNYFAWQAFGRAYQPGGRGSLPPYLRRENFAAIRDRAERVAVVNRSITDHLAEQPPASTDAYVLLDAQDWMTDAQLNALWSQIIRTAAPGARVIFRTAAEPSLLPGRVDQTLLGRWSYDTERSREATARDRSSIYGGFHLYRFLG